MPGILKLVKKCIRRRYGIASSRKPYLFIRICALGKGKLADLVYGSY
tara:strand:- start:134 stop:274 length:141 start_codon:yes stop_codon:yes gene_type:complete